MTTAHSGIALHLTAQEFHAFLLNYLRCTYEPNTTEHEATVFRLALETEDDIIFLSSKYRNDMLKKLPHLHDVFRPYRAGVDVSQELKDNHLFLINWLDPCLYQDIGDLYLSKEIPSENPEEICYKTKEINEKDVLIWANKPTKPWDFIAGKSYQSMDELIQEYKDRLHDYLQENFDWKEHIGFVEIPRYYC